MSRIDFYHREDQWQIPVVSERGEAVPFMRHIIMRLPEEQNAEFIYMVPFTPRGKDNLAAWMVARNDGERVRESSACTGFHGRAWSFGPQQIVNRINQDTEIVAASSRSGISAAREVIRGDLLVIPIEEVADLRAADLPQARGRADPRAQARGRCVPEPSGDGETLEQGLAEMFGGSTGRPPARPSIAADTGTSAGPATGDSPLAALLAEARRHYEAALQAQREIDWARYGEEMRKLGEVLARIGER